MALALMHAMDPVPALPPDRAHWQGFIDRAMAKMPEARFASAREMLLALDRIALAPRPSEPARTMSGEHLIQRLRTLRPAAWLTAAAVLLLVTVLVSGLWYRSSREVPAVVAAPQPATPLLAQAARPEPSFAVVPAMPSDDTGLDDAEDAVELLPELPPGEAALMTATEQIRRHRLTQPAGASAIDSLLEARRVLGPDARITAQAERWISTLHPYLARPCRNATTPPPAPCWRMWKSWRAGFPCKTAQRWANCATA